MYCKILFVLFSVLCMVRKPGCIIQQRLIKLLANLNEGSMQKIKSQDMAGIKIEKPSQAANNLNSDNDSQLMEVDESNNTWDEERLENALKMLKEIYIYVPIFQILSHTAC
jgi:hypothetical protein